jgi:cell division protein FtsB
MKRKRMSKKTQNFFQSIIFFGSTILVISCLITYLWVYTEIDETLLFIEIQTSTVRELKNEIYELKNSIESLNRADAIAKRAKKELKMVFTDPETLNVFLNLSNRSMF